MKGASMLATLDPIGFARRVKSMRTNRLASDESDAWECHGIHAKIEGDRGALFPSYIERPTSAFVCPTPPSSPLCSLSCSLWRWARQSQLQTQTPFGLRMVSPAAMTVQSNASQTGLELQLLGLSMYGLQRIGEQQDSVP
ncbi:hypothetical protein BST61_g10136 [Cercospora zeina]